MSIPIHPPIFTFYENNYKNLFDIIKIEYEDIPENYKICYNFWLYIIKQIDVCISVAGKKSKNFVPFDSFSFTSTNREKEHLFHDYYPIYQKNNIIFNLLPLNFLKKNLNYIFGFNEDPYISFRIEIGIHFENPENIFFSNEQFKIKVKLFDIDDETLNSHYQYYLSNKSNTSTLDSVYQ